MAGEVCGGRSLISLHPTFWSRQIARMLELLAKWTD